VRKFYFPIDELLARPRVRMLRVLVRYDDWMGSDDLYDACEVPEDPRARNSFSVELSRLVRVGEIERRKVRVTRLYRSKMGSIGQYQITDKGREMLRDLIARTLPSPEEFVDDDLGEGVAA
jgi:hypothetical protein